MKHKKQNRIDYFKISSSVGLSGLQGVVRRRMKYNRFRADNLPGRYQVIHCFL